MKASINYFFLSIVLLISTTILSGQNNDFEAFLKTLDKDLGQVGIAPLRLSYVNNLQSIPSIGKLKIRAKQLKEIEKGIQQVDLSGWDHNQKLNHKIALYGVQMYKERTNLEIAYRQEDRVENDQGLLYQALGKDWYEYYLKEWTNSDMGPDEIFTFGLEEIKRVKREMKKIQESSGMDSLHFYAYLNSDTFLLEDPKKLNQLFQERKQIILAHLAAAYPTDWNIPKLRIARGTNPALAQTPGYYNNNTFFYNLFDRRPFNLRQLDFLLLHEGSPGHHFQVNHAAQQNLPAYRSHFRFVGYIEGWAAYIEDHAQEIGLYRSPYDYFGKWEWDIVRSARVAMDVGINYYGWNDDEAMAFWKKYVPNQDEIAQREIDRMRRWPAQVLTYKLGASKINHLRKKEENHLGAAFDVLAFHQKILNLGAIPVKFLDDLLKDQG